MRILVLTQYFLPQPLANAEVVGGLAAGLAALGHQVDVVAPVAGDPGLAGVRLHRAPGWFPADRASRWKRVAEYLAFSVGAPLTALRLPRPDVVLVPSPPPTLGLVGLVVGRLRRAAVVYNVQDLYPEVAEATGVVRRGPLLELLRRLMRLVYLRCDLVTVIDPFFVPVLRVAEPGAAVAAVRNGIDLGPFRDARRDDAWLEGLGVPPGVPVVMYAGNVGRSQDVAALVAATAAAGAHLVVHGAGAALDDLRETVREGAATHVHLSGYVDRGRLGAVFASADLHVVPLRPGVAATAVPSKLLSIFAAGRPAVVAAEPGTPAASLVEEAGAGIVVPPGDADALARAVLEALADPARLERWGCAGRTWAGAHAGTERSAREYEALLDAVVGGSR